MVPEVELVELLGAVTGPEVKLPIPVSVPLESLVSVLLPSV